MRVLFLILLLGLTYGQSLVDIYSGKVKPKFELAWEVGGDNVNDEYMISNPRHLNLDTKGNLYFAEYGGDGIFKFNSNGKFIKKIGQKGEGPGEFRNCFVMTMDKNNNYFVYDIFNQRVNEFGNDDKFKKSIKMNTIIYSLDKLEDNKFIVIKDNSSRDKDFRYNNKTIIQTDSNLKTLKKLDSLSIKASKFKRTKER